MSDDKDLRIMFDNIGKIQYQIPVYQRGYDWDSKQVKIFGMIYIFLLFLLWMGNDGKYSPCPICIRE